MANTESPDSPPVPMSEQSIANQQIARATGIVMAGFILSNLTGLARTILVADAFGTQSALDAFNAAIRLPDTLFMLVAGGALASAFIPTFTTTRTTETKETGWKLASAVLNLISLVLVLASLLSWLFAPFIVSIALGRDFPPEQQALTVSLLRILLVSPVVFGASGLLMGVLNTRQHFLLPALAPTLHWVGYIIGIFLFVPALGIHGLAWGAVLGAVLHLGVQLPALRKTGWQYYPTFGLDQPAVREVARLMGPRLVGVAVVQLNFWVNVILATGMPTGSLTAIDYAWRIMTMPQVVIAQAIAIAALPTFSAQAARGAFSEMRSSLAATLRGVILLSLPASVGLILLRTPVVAMFFQRGEFDSNSTQLVAWALLWYTAGLVSHSVVEIVSRSFYALHDTKTPVIIGSLTMGLNVGLSLLLAGWFTQIGLPPHGGLALANTVATTLEMIVLLALMRRRLNGLEGTRIARSLIQAVLGSLVMGGGILLWMAYAAGRSPWMIGVGGIVLGGIIYAAAVMVLRVEEVGSILRLLQKRLNRRF